MRINMTKIAHLFNVSRPAVHYWRDKLMTEIFKKYETKERKGSRTYYFYEEEIVKDICVFLSIDKTQIIKNAMQDLRDIVSDLSIDDKSIDK